jgi:hypothetical protein
MSDHIQPYQNQKTESKKAIARKKMHKEPIYLSNSQVKYSDGSVYQMQRNGSLVRVQSSQG